MKTLTENNHQEIINAYSLQDWRPLLDLIPRIERQKTFSKKTLASAFQRGTILKILKAMERQALER